MQDVYFGSLGESPGEDAILSLYRNKTGRYTFSLPLVTGAILAGAGLEDRERLGELGEDMGLIFQIKDDEIGLFGEPGRTGKPSGSDLKENKKTLYHYYLLKNSAGSDRERLIKIMGSPSVSGDDIEFTRRLVSKLGIDEIISGRTVRLRDHAAGLIGGIENADPAGISVLYELLDYSTGRTS
jgi:geranylgeranyl diphosphate synthase type I